jgi:hypothetical protein
MSTPSDAEKLATSVFAAVEAYVARRFDPLARRLEQLEGRQEPDLSGLAQFSALVDARAEMLKADDALRDELNSLLSKASETGEAIADVALSVEFVGKRIDALPPPSPSSFVIDGAGEMVAVYPDGATKSVGRVRGEDGKRGASVMDGSIGDDGALTLRMSDGRIVNVGRVRGEPGAKGDDGVGRAGKDALELIPSAGLDESRSYPASSCFAYRGGVVIAFRATDPLGDDGDLGKAGWRVLLDGIAEETQESLDEGRYVERTTVYTSGRTFTRRDASSGMIYRGIYGAERLYLRGDCVTWNGSLWHAERPTKSKPPSDDWKLAVKAGRDASVRQAANNQDAIWP